MWYSSVAPSGVDNILMSVRQENALRNSVETA